MKKLFLFFCFGTGLFNCVGQSNFFTITGKVIDEATQMPLELASVFAKNTTLGTVTDASGNFKLALFQGGYELVISFAGYETEVRRISSGDSDNSDLRISLKQKQTAMESVTVKASNEVKNGWEQYGSFFLEQYIGKTSNSNFCSLSNPEALKFFFSKKKNRLKVLSNDPLLIENKALGYRIRYSLDSFIYEYNTQTCLYVGYPFFEEMKPTDSSEAALWSKNRVDAYYGSLLHFMRSVYHRRIAEDGFEIQFVINKPDSSFAIQLGDYYGALKYSKNDSSDLAEIQPNQLNLAVLYLDEPVDTLFLKSSDNKNNKHQTSVLTFAPEKSITIEPNGFHYDQTDITISGYLEFEKMADMVPFDYRPPDNN